MQPRSRRLPGAHGLELHVLEWSTEGVPLLFVHGFGNDARIWDDFAPLVAPYYRAFAYDQRGHGDSDRDAERRYEGDDLVEDLEALTDSLGIERMVLVGHSLGGRVSLLFAGRHPERMAGLVLVDVGPELDLRGVFRIRDDAVRAPESFASPGEYEELLSRAYPMAKPAILARIARNGLRKREDGRYESKLDPFFGRGLRDASDPALVEERASADSEALWEATKRVPCPTLVVRGAASDVLSPETADRMVDEGLADGTLAVVPRAAHAVMVDNPEGFREALMPFLLADD